MAGGWNSISKIPSKLSHSVVLWFHGKQKLLLSSVEIPLLVKLVIGSSFSAAKVSLWHSCSVTPNANHSCTEAPFFFFFNYVHYKCFFRDLKIWKMHRLWMLTQCSPKHILSQRGCMEKRAEWPEPLADRCIQCNAHDDVFDANLCVIMCTEFKYEDSKPSFHEGPLHIPGMTQTLSVFRL